MKKLPIRLFKISVFALIFLCQGASASVVEPVVSASLDRENAYVGDIIQFNVAVELPENAYLTVNKNIIFENFDTVKILTEHVSEKPNIYHITFNITSYKAGALDIEPVGVNYIDSSGRKRMFFTPPANIHILSMLGSESKDIRDIKPLKKVSIKLSHAAVAALLIVFTVIIFIFIIRDIFRSMHKAPYIVGPKEEALAMLDKLRESEIIKNDQPRIFYYRAAEILRTYISKKYDFNAMEMTSTELVKKFEEIPEFSIPKKDLRQYLGIFDLARYAGFKASQTDMLESLETTKDFVRKL